MKANDVNNLSKLTLNLFNTLFYWKKQVELTHGARGGRNSSNPRNSWGNHIPFWILTIYHFEQWVYVAPYNRIETFTHLAAFSELSNITFICK